MYQNFIRAWNFVSHSPCLWKGRSSDCLWGITGTSLRDNWDTVEHPSASFPKDTPGRCQLNSGPGPKSRAWPVLTQEGKLYFSHPAVPAPASFQLRAFPLSCRPQTGTAEKSPACKSLAGRQVCLSMGRCGRGRQPAAPRAQGHWQQGAKQAELHSSSVWWIPWHGLCCWEAKSTTENADPLLLRMGWLSITGAGCHHLPRVQQYIMQLTSDIHTNV